MNEKPPDPAVLEYVGARISKMLEDSGLSQGQALVKSRHRIKPPTWSLLLRGRLEPSERVLEILGEMFPKEDISDMYHVLGHLTPQEHADYVKSIVGGTQVEWVKIPSAYVTRPVSVPATNTKAELQEQTVGYGAEQDR